MALEITDSNVNELMAQGKPIVIDFWAPWCGPCKMVGPMVEELGEKYKEELIVGKCDIDENADLPAQYGIRNIPTLLFIKDGEVVDKLVGAVPKSAIEEKLKGLL